MLNSVVTAFPDAVYVLMNWVRNVSSSLDFYPNHLFLTLAMLTTDFAFTFDMKEAETYMYRAKFATSQCPFQYVRGPQSNNALHEMLRCLNQKSPASLPEGISFIWYVMQLNPLASSQLYFFSTLFQVMSWKEKFPSTFTFFALSSSASVACWSYAIDSVRATTFIL
jgi:hypothetical protein